ncbi:MAG: hypothetical protein AB2421_14975 [Thermotaleaceae bacterium]
MWRRRRIGSRLIGLFLLATGLVIVSIMILPYTIWLFLLGCCMLYLGYKLFI